ncbi:beta-1,4-galactosyltransferase 1-like [Lampetra fluviatilis]
MRPRERLFLLVGLCVVVVSSVFVFSKYVDVRRFAPLGRQARIHIESEFVRALLGERENRSLESDNSEQAKEDLKKFWDNDTTLHKAEDRHAEKNVTKVVVTKAPEGPQECPEMSRDLVGPLRIEFTDTVSMELVAEQNEEVTLGGRYHPKDCTPRQRVAIIIPYRKRTEHLLYWLYYMHPILRRQQMDYGVFIVHQAGDATFNRAKLLNVGTREALAIYPWDCIVFSDIDIVPMDDRNTYACGEQPRHIASAMDKFNFHLPYETYFGGVVSMRIKHFEAINGFSNNYWGWGTEDDDLYKRVIFKGLNVERPPPQIARTKMIRHDRDKGNEVNAKNYDLYARTRVDMDRDGLNSLKYRLISVTMYKLYTEIYVDIGLPN